MVPLVQYIPSAFLNTVVGSIYIESLYSIPGMGKADIVLVALVHQDVYKRQAQICSNIWRNASGARY